MAQEPDPSLALVAQLCSKLCHDLAGVIGAIANGAELLEDEDDEEIRNQAVELLAQSAEQAGRRLRFFRIAFGAGGAIAWQAHVGGFLAGFLLFPLFDPVRYRHRTNV